VFLTGSSKWWENNLMTQNDLVIANRKIGRRFSPYIIAEVSANHNGKFETAVAIMEAAKKTGADAVKLQTYTPDTLTLNSTNPDFVINGGLWNGRNLYELYQEAHMPWEWHKPLFEHARKIGMTIFSSAFDNTAVDLLESLDTPAYKIASFEAIDLPLIKYTASTKKPMIISTGLADAEEIAEAVDAAKSAGCKELALLHCVSGYPAPAGDYNLHTIPDMIKKFGVPVGLSDHTLDNTTAIASIAMGACIIEKHFTLDRNGGGPDDSFSLEPKEMAELCTGARTAQEAMGRVDYGTKSSERGNLAFRRSLYFVRALKAGETISADCVRSVRPGFGLPPKYLERIIGKKVSRDVDFATPVLREVIADEIN
jgi:pseudaminic acid synthase